MDVLTNWNANRDAAKRDAETAMTALGEDIANSRGLIDAYATAVADEAEVRAAWEMDGRPSHAIGSAGQLVTHPLVKTLQEARADIARLAKSLNLTPESRARRRVGAPMGSSTAPDRRGPTRLRKAA